MYTFVFHHTQFIRNIFFHFTRCKRKKYILLLWVPVNWILFFKLKNYFKFQQKTEKVYLRAFQTLWMESFSQHLMDKNNEASQKWYITERSLQIDVFKFVIWFLLLTSKMVPFLFLNKIKKFCITLH